MTKEFAIENAVDPAVHVYVTRAQDQLLIDALHDAFITHVQGSRMCGKSSLLLRASERLRDSDVITVYADLQTVVQVDAPDLLGVVQRLLATLARRAGIRRLTCLEDHKLQVPVDLLAAGLAELNASRESQFAEPRAPQLVLMLDELDTILSFRWSAAFFAMLRDLRLRARTDPLLAGLRIVVAGVRPFRHLVADAATSSIGAPDASIWLDDFPNDTASAAALQEGFPPEMADQSSALAWKALEFSGGYPQACTWLCRAMVHEGMSGELPELETRLVRFAERERRSSQPIVFFSYPEDYMRSYAREPATISDEDPASTALEALWIYLDLLARRDIGFDGNRRSHELLRWAGLARCDQTGVLRSRSPLLERFYTPDWTRLVRRAVEASRVWTGTPQLRSRRSSSRVLPKICVLTTGGTIGMVEDETGKVRAPSSSEELTQAYGAVGRIAEVEFVPALDDLRDSANIVPAHWSIIAQRVAERVADPNIAGVVVTHGTDTLAYTASAVAYALGGHLTKPVVFTGSQATVDVVHGDALANLLRASKVAAEAGQRLPEVVLCFGDQVLRACRAQKKDDRRFDAFESPLCPPLAVIAEEIDYNDAAIRRINGTPPPLELRPEFDSNILTIAQVPGLRPSLLEPVLDSENGDESLRGILIQSLGAGNLPTEPEYSLVSFIEKAVERDIPVVLGSPYPVLTSNPEKYAPAEAAIRAGALPLFNITLPALITKLAWMLGRMPTDLHHADPRKSLRRAWVRERIRTNYVGETDDVIAHIDFAP